MDNKKTDEYYIQKVIDDIEFVIAHAGGLSREEFNQNDVLIDSVMFRLIQVSENSDKLSEAFKTQHMQIPWRALKGMRNRIVHEYGNVDFSVVYDTVQSDLPELLETLKTALTAKA